jgi:hypothetical protein
MNLKMEFRGPSRAPVLAISMILSIIFGACESVAQLNERRVFYKSVRYQGMGGASIAVANDETAIAINPAGLGKLREAYGTVVDPEIEINTRGLNAYNSKAYSDPYRLKEVLPTMATKLGQHFSSRGQIMPSYVAKNFGIAILQKYDLAAQATSSTAIDTFYRDDLALLVGYNLRLFDGRVKLGVTGKMISRIELNETALDPTQPLQLKSLGTAGFAKSGTGFGFDAGLLLAAPWQWLPTIGVVYRDVGGMSFSQSTYSRLSSATSAPDAVKSDLDIGLALFPIQSNSLRTSFSLEYRGLLTQSSQADKAKLIHAGYEMNFSDIFFWRVGYHQRYWTTGIELASERFQFQLASYGEEIGTQSNPKEDRRWALKFGFRF